MVLITNTDECNEHLYLRSYFEPIHWFNGILSVARSIRKALRDKIYEDTRRFSSALVVFHAHVSKLIYLDFHAIELLIWCYIQRFSADASHFGHLKFRFDWKTASNLSSLLLLLSRIMSLSKQFFFSRDDESVPIHFKHEFILYAVRAYIMYAITKFDKSFRSFVWCEHV